MRFLSLLIIVTLSCQIALGQRATSKNFNRKVEVAPEYPVENLESIAFKFYYPYETITQDTLRKYIGNMRILEGDLAYIELGGPKYKSLRPLQMVDENWDMLVEVAFEDIGVKEKSLVVDTIETLLGLKPIYYYNVIHEMPTFVKITNRAGEVLDRWSPNAKKTIKFDRRYEGEYSEDGDTIFMTNDNYFSEKELRNAYQKKGEAKISRMSFLYSVSLVLEKLYPKIYYSEHKDKLQINTGKHRKHNYSELDDAQKDAVKKLEKGRIEELAENITIWEKYLQQYDSLDIKAKINDAVAVGLHRNLAIAHLYRRNFDKALHHARMSNKPVRQGSFTVQTTGTRNEVNILPMIESRARAYQNNAHIERPEKLNRFFNFKKEIGKKR
ncbi:MAG: hypothetical protein P1U70_18215 [Saprospiraceae bacterium]|jgi:hypothetical protein|nr:hypothetical protein [Saprospiraceae bacterium]